MHYPIAPGLIVDPKQYAATGITPAGGLSEEDKRQIRIMYPPLSPNDSLPVLKYQTLYMTSISPGQQVDLRIEPPQSKTYTIQTTGESDTVMALFETKDDATAKGVLESPDSVLTMRSMCCAALP